MILTIAANGLCLPPYVIYKSLRLYSEWCPKNLIKGVVFNGTKSGWTDEDCFFDYLKNLFIPNTKHLQKPLLVIFDGHYSHLSIKSVRLAIELNICLLCLPSHSTHLLQPLDIYTLQYVKQQWKELLWERNKTTSTKLNKRDFIQLFSKLYKYALIPAHCLTAFAKAGTFPSNRRAIKNDRIIKNGLSTAAIPSQHFFQATSTELDTSLNPNGTLMMSAKTLIKSNSSPNLLKGNF